MESQTYLTLILFSLIKIIYCDTDIVTPPNGTIFYYAYGSNLLAKRLHIHNPSAVFYSIAKLKNHRLDFNMHSDLWNGAVATIVEDEDEDVWGALWTLDSDNVHHLDQQEGVAENWYFAKNVTVTTPKGKKILARTYEETHNPNKTAFGTDLPIDRRPSNTYLEVLALGAIESHLPADYIGFLFSFPTNGKMASERWREELGYPF